MTASEDPLALLGRVCRALEDAGIPCVVVGAYATFAYGDARTTGDADVAALAGRDHRRVAGILTGLGAKVDGPFSTHWGPRLIAAFPTLPVDVFIAPDHAQFDRARRVDLGGVTLPVISPEDLVVTKLANFVRFGVERADDLADAAGVVQRSRRVLDMPLLRALAKERDVLVNLEALVKEADRVAKRRRRPGAQ